MLYLRLLTSAALLAALLGALFLLPPLLWEILLLLVAAVAAGEWSRLCSMSRIASSAYVVATVAAGVLLLVGSKVPGAGIGAVGTGILAAAAIFWCVVAPAWLARRWQPRARPLLAAVGWIVLLPAVLALALLRDAGPGLLLGLMAVVWIADSAAYFAGKAFGRHKLAPAISPGKTWEGVAGAVLAVTLYGLAWRWNLASGQIGEALAALAFIAGLWALTALSVIGDLFESWMKRSAGVKDSGRLLPGHGGVLDRIDGLTASLPAAALALTFLGYWR